MKNDDTEPISLGHIFAATDVAAEGEPTPRADRARLRPLEADTSDRNDDRRPIRRFGLDSLTIVPVVFALILGLVYFVGAFLKTTELHGAGLSIRDTLPLVPIEQLLTRGIGAVIGSFLIWLPFMAVTILLYLELEWLDAVRERVVRRREDERRKDQAVKEDIARIVADAVQRDDAEGLRRQVRRLEELLRKERKVWLRRTVRLGLSLPLILVLVTLLLILPPILAVGTLMLSAVFLVNRFTTWQKIALAYAFFALAFLTNSFVEPQPLAHATITTLHGVTRGRLVTATAENWYVAKGSGSVVAIPAREIVSATIKSAHQREFKRTSEYLGIHSTWWWNG